MATSRTPLFDSDEPTATEGFALEESGPVGAAPEADVVAGRALMIAALAERARLESDKDPERRQQLAKWVEAHGLYGNLGEAGVELFDAPLGSWTDEDIDTVGWATEELQVLLWALERLEFPKLDERPDQDVLINSLPMLREADTFIDTATLRSHDEIEATLGLCEAVLEAVRSEVYARSILEDPTALEVDEELEEMLASIEVRGFKRQEAAQRGKAAEAVEGLRYWGRTLLMELFADGSPHAVHRFDSAKLVSLDDASLATFLGSAQSRADALAWLVEGDEEAGD